MTATCMLRPGPCEHEGCAAEYAHHGRHRAAPPDAHTILMEFALQDHDGHLRDDAQCVLVDLEEGNRIRAARVIEDQVIGQTVYEDYDTMRAFLEELQS